MIITLIGLVVLITLHELGHFALAKKDGIYKGWSIFPTPHIKISKPYDNRWKYLSGIAVSMLSFPIFILDNSFPLAIRLFMGPTLALSLGVLDLVTVVFYGKL